MSKKQKSCHDFSDYSAHRIYRYFVEQNFEIALLQAPDLKSQLEATRDEHCTSEENDTKTSFSAEFKALCDKFNVAEEKFDFLSELLKLLDFWQVDDGLEVWGVLWSCVALWRVVSVAKDERFNIPYTTPLEDLLPPVAHDYQHKLKEHFLSVLAAILGRRPFFLIKLPTVILNHGNCCIPGCCVPGCCIPSYLKVIGPRRRREMADDTVYHFTHYFPNVKYAPGNYICLNEFTYSVLRGVNQHVTFKSLDELSSLFQSIFPIFQNLSADYYNSIVVAGGCFTDYNPAVCGRTYKFFAKNRDIDIFCHATVPNSSEIKHMIKYTIPHLDPQISQAIEAYREEDDDHPVRLRKPFCIHNAATKVGKIQIITSRSADIRPDANNVCEEFDQELAKIFWAPFECKDAPVPGFYASSALFSRDQQLSKLTASDRCAKCNKYEFTQPIFRQIKYALKGYATDEVRAKCTEIANEIIENGACECNAASVRAAVRERRNQLLGDFRVTCI